MADNLETAVSPDGALEATLVASTPLAGTDGCETRIDYATYDVNKHAEHSFFTNSLWCAVECAIVTTKIQGIAGRPGKIEMQLSFDLMGGFLNSSRLAGS